MTVLKLRHSTTYRYKRPVQFGDHSMMFRPRDSHDLRLIDTALRISPPAERVRWRHDLFGNSIAVASFAEPSDRLFVESEIKLEHFVDTVPEFTIEPYARYFPFAYSTEEVPDLGRTRERHYPDPDHLVDAWARRFLSKNGNGNGHVETMAVLIDMTKTIQREFQYAARHVEGTQSPVETLTLGTGSCRDYALLMMEACRTFGLAARFVSGYVYDSQLATTANAGVMVGTGETHAWVQIYLPGAGWVEFDPTNGLVGGVNLIRVAVARDPKQAVPLAGTFEGFPDDYLGMHVEVTVMTE